jgi:hypothetical protein
VVHKHYIDILWTLFIWLFVAIIPSFLYYYSIAIQVLIPFYVLEIFLVLVYLRIIYKIFDWYNDVWIVTEDGVTDLQWSLFRANMNNVTFNNIEWLWVEQDGIVDKLLSKWDMVIHKMWNDIFTLKNVYKPFAQLDKIEKISWEIGNYRGTQQISEKFDMVMDRLGWILEKYMESPQAWEKEIIREEDTIKKYQRKQWTINLR